MFSSFTNTFKRKNISTPEITPVLVPQEFETAPVLEPEVLEAAPVLEPEVLEPAPTPTVPNPVLTMSTDALDYPGTGNSWTNSMGQSVSFLGFGYVSDAPVYFALDGSGDYIGTGYVEATRSATITMEQWLAANNWNSGTSANYDTALSCAQYGGYRSSIFNGEFVSIVHANGDYVVSKTDVSGFAAGSWHHFTTTYDGRYLKLYVDGVLKDTADAGGDYDIYYKYKNALFIGAEADQSGIDKGKEWAGKVALTRIYDGAWNAEGVVTLYEENKTRFTNW